MRGHSGTFVSFLIDNFVEETSKHDMPRRRRIYEGKAKVLFEGPEPGTIVQYFKDDATAFNNKKKGTITGKGVLNNRISEFLMTKLSEIGIPTHFVRRLNMREQLVKKVEIIPVEVVVRNVAAGSFSKRFGINQIRRDSNSKNFFKCNLFLSKLFISYQNPFPFRSLFILSASRWLQSDSNRGILESFHKSVPSAPIS